MPGLLVEQDGVVGVLTAQGFISLQQITFASQTVGLVIFPPPNTTMETLMEFIQAHADDCIVGGVTTFSGP